MGMPFGLPLRRRVREELSDSFGNGHTGQMLNPEPVAIRIDLEENVFSFWRHDHVNAAE